MLNTGDFILATGHGYFEKASVVKVEGKVAFLNNGIKCHKRSLQPLNSKMVLEEFDPIKYEQLVCKRDLPKLVKNIEQVIISGSLDDATITKVHKKLSKVLLFIKE